MFLYFTMSNDFSDNALNNFRDMHRKIVETLKKESNAIIIFIATYN